MITQPAAPRPAGLRPYRPRALAFVNALGAQLARLGVGSDAFSERELLSAARARTGLSNYGDESFREPLRVLLDSIEREARLHTIGRLVTKVRLVAALCTRLKVAELLRKNPAIAREDLPPPIVIAGLQRTGTTMLHRLLASDPRLRALRAWEAMAPAGSSARFGVEPRFVRAKLSERALSYMAPSFFAIHPIEADAPEEDVLLLDCSFLSTVPEATLHVPSYARFLETRDHTPAYTYLSTLLRVLTHQRGPARWVLKTPHHLEHLDLLQRVFPGAQIVQTHRDPTRTLASFCSMVWHGRGVFSDEVDAHEIGRHWSHKIGRMLGRSLTVRSEQAERGFHDVSYYQLARDPLAAVERLYDSLGLELDARVRARMRETLGDNPQHKYGRHDYALGDFGLTAQGVEPLLASYRARFAIPKETRS